MKIQEVEVERCGVWRQWTLPLSEGGIHVFHGPNEAGKTTLRRFIRGVLYGFPAQSADPDCVPLRPASGALRIAAEGRIWRLHRAAAADGTGNVTLFSGEDPEPASARLETWFQGISEQIFEDVFAVGLRELQQLATLSDDEAASRIYGITLGPEGQRLLDISRQSQADRSRLLDPQRGTGLLVELLDERDRLQADLVALKSQQEEYTSLSLRREQVDREIADLKQRQAGIQHELRGHKLLERAHGPWQQLQECEERLNEIPDVRNFPEDGLEKLDKLDADMEMANRTRQGLLAELQQWREKARITIEPRLRQHAASLQGLVAQRGLLQDLNGQLESAQARVMECDQALAAAREHLDPAWTDSRLAAIDLTPAAYQRLTNQAESLRSAKGRAAALRRSCLRLKASIRRRRELLDVRLLELGGTTVAEALTTQRERLERLQELVRLRQSAIELEQRQTAISEHRVRVAPREQLPRWVQIMLRVFGIAGFGLGVLGLIMGFQVGALAGSIYGLMGVTCLGLAAGLKQQYEHDARQNLDELDSEQRNTASRLRETQESISKLKAGPELVDRIDEEIPSDDSAGPAVAIPGSQIVIEDPEFRENFSSSSSEQDVIQQVQGYLAELQEMGLAERRLLRAGRTLRQLRTKREIARREVTTASENWTELLRQLKFPETLDAASAVSLWQSLFNVLETHRREQAACNQAEHLLSLTGSFRDRIKEQGNLMQDFQSDYDRPLEILDGWEEQLGELARQRKCRGELREKIVNRRREIRQFVRQLTSLRAQRNVLLVQGGATNRDDFEQRAAWSVQISELEQEQSTLLSSLDAIQAEFTDIAIVEEDLQEFNADDNSRALETLNREANDLSGDLERSFERLGSLKHEIGRLEEDDQAADLRFELAQVQRRLQLATAEWFAVESAAQSFDQIRRQFERTHQPEMLSAASRFLEKLTLGKYRSVWMPLGERVLQVDDEHGSTLPVERLSRGTREQLFLAVRLAVVHDLAGRGIQLPLILDDVFVNFDEQRTDAALDLLLEFASRGQQILFFTCHKWLAEQFASRGAQTVHLPGHASENSSGQRLAG
jgi:uncharacterized protein YhaN